MDEIRGRGNFAHPAGLMGARSVEVELSGMCHGSSFVSATRCGPRRKDRSMVSTEDRHLLSVEMSKDSHKN